MKSLYKAAGSMKPGNFVWRTTPNVPEISKIVSLTPETPLQEFNTKKTKKCIKTYMCAKGLFTAHTIVQNWKQPNVHEYKTS